MITQAQHTPGPWAQGGAMSGETRIYAADGGEVAVATRSDPKHRYAAEANARLIAAAPDLLAACEAMLAEPSADWPVDRIRELVARARGQS